MAEMWGSQDPQDNKKRSRKHSRKQEGIGKESGLFRLEMWRLWEDAIRFLNVRRM